MEMIERRHSTVNCIGKENQKLADYVNESLELITYRDGTYRLAINDIVQGVLDVPSGVDRKLFVDHCLELSAQQLQKLVLEAPSREQAAARGIDFDKIVSVAAAAAEVELPVYLRALRRAAIVGAKS